MAYQPSDFLVDFFGVFMLSVEENHDGGVSKVAIEVAGCVEIGPIAWLEDTVVWHTMTQN